MSQYFMRMQFMNLNKLLESLILKGKMFPFLHFKVKIMFPICLT